jgi:hypothetical protein
VKELIRRFAWKLLGPPPGLARPPWERPLDTLEARRNVLDMAICNIQVGTRNEAVPARGAEHDSLLGDYLEFGVYQGASFIYTARRAEQRIPSMRFFAFDSFEGLPVIHGHDRGGEFSAGQFSCTQDEFEAHLVQQQVDTRRCIIVPGWYEASLTDKVKDAHQLHVASIVFIDCDLYESCVPVLSFLTSLVRQGSILIFDDWLNFRADPSRGVQRATREWLAANPALSLTPWFDFCHHGKAFIVNRSG